MKALEEASKVVEEYLEVFEQYLDVQMILLGEGSPRVCTCQNCRHELDTNCLWLFDMRNPEE